MLQRDTIPVIVDDIKNYPSFKMIRFIYLSIEVTDNYDNWILGLKMIRIPFGLNGLQGIINSPIKGRRFMSYKDIDKLFDTIEETEGFFIDINDIWIPTSLISREARRGDVYRIPNGLFNLAIKFRYDKITSEEYLIQSEVFAKKVLYSKGESSSFSEWNKRKIQEAKDIYPKNFDLKLDYQENIK